SGIGATLSERSCRRPQYLQPPAPSRLPVDASDLPIRSSGAMAQRDQRGTTTVRAPRILTRTPQLDTALVVHVRHLGLIVFSACSHAGIVNLCPQVRNLFPDIPIYCVMGGLH